MFTRTPVAVRLKLAASVLLLTILNITNPFPLESASVESNLTIVVFTGKSEDVIEIDRSVGVGVVGVLSLTSVKQIVTLAVIEVVDSDTTVVSLRCVVFS